jgi:hypothetical protein
MSRRHTLSLIALVALAGCASSGSGTAATTTNGQTGTRQTRRDPSVITAEELASAPQGDLYGAIQQLRPNFMQMRGATTFGIATGPEVIQVYVDGVLVGDTSVLKQYQTRDTKEVRKLSAADATQKYGTGHSQGAILVTRRDR